MTIRGRMVGPIRSRNNIFDHDIYQKFDGEMIGYYKHLIFFYRVTTDHHVYDTILGLYDDQLPTVTIESLKIPFTWRGYIEGSEVMRYWSYRFLMNGFLEPEKPIIPFKKFFWWLMDKIGVC